VGHTPVLYDETFSMLDVKPGETWVDCTFGRGGHTKGFLDRVGDQGQVIALDQDYQAIEHAKTEFKEELESKKLLLIHTNFQNLSIVLNGLGIHPDGVFADFGLSSPQLDNDHRGFSYRNKDAKLDMRMNDKETTKTAADILNQYSGPELTSLFRLYSEEPRAPLLSKRILERREEKPFETVGDFYDISQNLWKQSRRNPSAKHFQALRIEVNGELDVIHKLLKQSFERVKKGGKLGFIAFHSLEDKIVKDQFKFWQKGPSKAKTLILQEKLPITDASMRQLSKTVAKIIKPFPAKATDEETKRNVRSRTARLRCLEKL